LLFFAAILMPPLGGFGLSAIPRVCCTTYIATYCDVSTKKVRVTDLVVSRNPGVDHANFS
jgi:hypothetical protein